jgi:hypothetical protein
MTEQQIIVLTENAKRLTEYEDENLRCKLFVCFMSGYMLDEGLAKALKELAVA